MFILLNCIPRCVILHEYHSFFGKLFYYFFTWLLRPPMTYIKLYAEMNGLEPSNNKIVIVVIYLGSQSCLFQFGYISISCGYPRSIPTRDLIIFLRQILLPNRIASFSRNSHYKLLSQTGVPNNFLWQHYKNVATFIWSTFSKRCIKVSTINGGNSQI